MTSVGVPCSGISSCFNKDEFCFATYFQTGRSKMSSSLRVACICASNMNRSMAAHEQLVMLGFPVRSYGTGQNVKLPGQSADRPVVFPFGTPYESIAEAMRRISVDKYTSNGVLAMLDRNAKMKGAPEQWSLAVKEKFDVIIAFEARVFESIVEGFISARAPVSFAECYVINLEIRDTHADAKGGARVTAELVQALDALGPNLSEGIYGVINDISEKTDSHIFCVPVFF